MQDGFILSPRQFQSLTLEDLYKRSDLADVFTCNTLTMQNCFPGSSGLGFYKQTSLEIKSLKKTKILFLSDCYSTALKVWNLLKHIWHLKLYHMHFCVRMCWVFNPSVMTKIEMQVGFRLELGTQNSLQYIKAMIQLVCCSLSKVASIRFFRENHTNR